jgi:hypothetical protein
VDVGNLDQEETFRVTFVCNLCLSPSHVTLHITFACHLCISPSHRGSIWIDAGSCQAKIWPLTGGNERIWTTAKIWLVNVRRPARSSFSCPRVADFWAAVLSTKIWLANGLAGHGRCIIQTCPESPHSPAAEVIFVLVNLVQKTNCLCLQGVVHGGGARRSEGQRDLRGLTRRL